jgi:hypothetical protein
MGLLDILTGGENNKAADALKHAEEVISGVATPTQAQLTLPQLQQYVNAGLMTPAQATAALQGSNAFNNVNVDPSSMEAEQHALSQLQGIADKGGMDAQSQAALSQALNQVQTQEHGAQGAILDQMAQRGIPTSLMGTASALANAGNESQSANLSATQAAGDAEQRALQALEQSGQLGGQIHGQQYQEAANKAAAQNAINQWNAQTQTGVNVGNAGLAQQANAYNAQNAQDVANANTGTSNARTQYNAQVPETVFQNNLGKANAIAGVNQQQANQATNAGKQNAGLISGLIGTGATLMAPQLAPVMAASQAGTGYQNGPPASANTQQYAPAGYDHGGKIPGHPMVPGDSPKNDFVHAMLSPGEVVLPRSVASNPSGAKDFVQHLMSQRRPAPRGVHPDDIHAVMEALTRRRAGQEAA